jgi:hypothetical protein
MMNDELTRFEAGPVGDTALKSLRPDGASQRLTVVSALLSPSRPGTNLAKVFGQFVEVQQQVAEQVVALEESFNQERQEAASVTEQVPELWEKINWLVDSFYEQSQHNACLEERFNRQADELSAARYTVESLCEAHQQWQATMDQLIEAVIDLNRLA